jgi:hypothetical protein
MSRRLDLLIERVDCPDLTISIFREDLPEIGQILKVGIDDQIRKVIVVHVFGATLHGGIVSVRVDCKLIELQLVK